MRKQHISLKDTGRFSQLICDYLIEKKSLKEFYGHYPNLENTRIQMELKKDHYSKQSRIVLVKALNSQYAKMSPEKAVIKNLKLLANENTFTVTTGHQLCLMTGPIYFIYKIISTINLCKKLKLKYPKSEFIPVYWMASEDHDFEEINSFNFQDKKIQWKRNSAGAVGDFPLNDLQEALDIFETNLGNHPEVTFIKELLEKSYRKAVNLSEATFKLVDQLFGSYGLIVLEPNQKVLKSLFSPIIKDELTNASSFKSVTEQINLIKTNYNKKYTPQVNPREINLFYLTPQGRYRIKKTKNGFSLIGAELNFTKDTFFKILKKYPERFSPNVILRPLYQEIILPNLHYIGGGGEIAYWLQLKKNFDRYGVPFPLLLLRNSALIYSNKLRKKIDKLNLTLSDLFLKREVLVNKKIKQISSIDLDLKFLKIQLEKQFNHLQSLVSQTDKSFEGAVSAQLKKQTRGIDYLEKRLLKAQKNTLSDQVQRLSMLHSQLFPDDQLQERTLNFVSFYLEIGEQMIPSLIENLDPLNPDFTLIEY